MSKVFDIIFAPAYAIIGFIINILCKPDQTKVIVKDDEELSPDKSTDSSVQYWLDNYGDKECKKNKTKENQ